MEKGVRFTKIIFVLFLFVVFVGSNALSQENYLNKKITISISKQKLKNVLNTIGTKAGFEFSYNVELYNFDSIVSINAENKSVKKILDKLFDNKIEYKIVGRHIVLLNNNEIKKVEKEHKALSYEITGYIIDSETGKKVRNATIYDIDGESFSSTNENGYYTIDIPTDKEFRGLSYCKRGYLDTVIIIKPIDYKSLNIELIPKYPEVEKMPLKTLEEDTNKLKGEPIVNFLVNSESIDNIDNIEIYEKRIGQVSIIPFTGTNREISGAIVNNLSLNVFAGYADGVDGVEVGSFVNIDRSYVNGVQVAGFANIVGKYTRGVQIAGFSNKNTGSIKGVQIAGFNNIVLDTITGVQIAGFSNVLKGKMKGLQIAGFSNHTTQDVDGVQIAGFSNTTPKDVVSMQLSGFANVCKNVNGLQVAGFANVTGTARKGLQLSGFINLAKELRACQIGVVNICDTSTGFSFGLISHIQKGYRAVEIYANEVFYSNFSYKSGTRTFHNIYTFGFDPTNPNLWHAGLGFGSVANLGKRLAINFDASVSFVHEDLISEPDLNLLNRFNAALEIKLFKHLSFFAGPSFVLQVSEIANPLTGELYSNIALNPFYEKSATHSKVQMWTGAKLALKFIISKNV